MTKQQRELTPDEETSTKNIISELCGYSIEEAEVILKAVATRIRQCAVIEEALDNG